MDASSEVVDANMLADLLEKKIEKVGKEYVVQIVTDNGSNYKAAGRILMERILTLFWTPCAAHCLDLMLEDIGKIHELNKCINNAKKVCIFIYKHGRVLDLMRDKIDKDLVRSTVTRFATSFLTLAIMHKNKNGLRNLFVSEEWQRSSLSNLGIEGGMVERIILSMTFWTSLENCMRASQPLLIALRIADGDETPVAPEIMAAMDTAKNNIKDSLRRKQQLLHEVLNHFDMRWDNQIEQKLYGVALFLNPTKFFPIREADKRQASRLRSMFNDVLWKMVTDDDEQSKISSQADDYERSEVHWWGAYGGLAFELQYLVNQIVSLCCSSSGCERNCSAFAHIHTKRRNRLEHKRLNKLMFVSYNWKMTNRFEKIQELGSKGKKYNSLVLEEFQWENEWVDGSCEQVHQGLAADRNDITWAQVDEAVGATQGLRGRNLPRTAVAHAMPTTTKSTSIRHTYGRKRKHASTTTTEDIVEDEESSEHDEGDEDFVQPQGSQGESDQALEGNEDDGGGGFQLDDDLLL
ncbi:uncharacterized protein LOC133903176 [Phragmites australis]|uniref:uncharacterized protein LOC133903176 n=1 Tax=Phragmites australis TaxID=29695 RepID=UPI002D795E47|nr:uncharacterized protein LOC133903176 [Phragmites australis]